MRLLRLRTVLVATDLDASSDAAIDSATRLAAATGATLHVVHVADPDGGLASTPKSPEREQGVRHAMERARSRADDARIHVIPGDPRTTIGPLADALNADVIVMGRHRDKPPREGAAVGGTASAVIRNTRAPCLVVSRPLALPIDRVLIAVDESETARGALVVAVSWASALRRRGTSAAPSVTAVHVDVGASDASHEQAVVDQEIAALRRISGDWAGVTATGVTLGDPDPIAAITHYAEQLDPGLVVLGTRALGRPTHPALGSVASAVTRQLAMPVLLVPPAVWREYARDLVA